MIERAWDGLIRGDFFRIVFYLMLRILAIMTGLVGLFVLIGMSIELMRGATFGGMMGGFIFLGLFLVVLVILVLNFWKRAAVLRSIPGDDFPLFDMSATVLRLIGETSAIGLAFLGVWGGFLNLFRGIRIVDQLPFLLFPITGMMPGFLSALTLLVVYLVLAVLVIFWNYFLAELVILLKGIYRNTQSRA
jgi:hypothetical protein